MRIETPTVRHQMLFNTSVRYNTTMPEAKQNSDFHMLDKKWRVLKNNCGLKELKGNNRASSFLSYYFNFYAELIPDF